MPGSGNSISNVATVLVRVEGARRAQDNRRPRNPDANPQVQRRGSGVFVESGNIGTMMLADWFTGPRPAATSFQRDMYRDRLPEKLQNEISEVAASATLDCIALLEMAYRSGFVSVFCQRGRGRAEETRPSPPPTRLRSFRQNVPVTSTDERCQQTYGPDETCRKRTAA